ncbi:hypothetical protein I2I05_18420 [Hymenobacter sp. BT683]|uniref:Glycosyltransferase RgtA/B/C/D-like domain-containing protein n=1 Tax=Hymenobacter jeongseonensis TaxID=2791027 RepID=A0ABS0IMX5_9BACT|nr:hypothetical protein [Hymenobacter jeongseonensis]MBF9239374.1 hypothetical protein [Hymenobacter jeongseonensis]
MALPLPENLHWPRWFGWSVALAVLVQLALFALATGPGLAGTADSGYYVHAATTLRTAGRLLHPDGSAYRYWPPLYPVLVSLGGSLAVLRLLHGAAMVVSLVAWSRLGRWLLPGSLALVFPWLLAFSTPWLVVSKFVWGEAVFLALFAGYAAALFRWLRQGQRQWWWLATALGFLLPLQRTAGFFLLAGTALSLLLARRSLGWKRLLPVAGHTWLALLGGVVWHVYALLVAAPSVYRLNRGWPQFFSSAADYGFVVSRWLLPVRAAWRPELSLLWAPVLAGLLALLWPRAPQPEAVGAGHSGSELVGPHRFLRVLWIAVLAFVLLLLISTTFTRSAAGLYDAERYASVLFGPVVLLALQGMGRWFESKPGNRSWSSWLVVGIVSMWLVYSAGRTISNARALRKLAPMAWTAAQ